MLSALLLAASLWLLPAVQAQTVLITDDPAHQEGEASAVLDVHSEFGGLLVPRMPAALREAIASPATGLLVFQTDGDAGFYFNAGKPVSPNWLRLGDSSQADGSGTGMVSDVDGNAYVTVRIGSHYWMAENLRVTHFRSGEAISQPGREDWIGGAEAGMSWYDNREDMAGRFGALYNAAAVTDPAGICPPGWELPGVHHFQDLMAALGSEGAVGKALRGLLFWDDTVEGNNHSGFSALPAGFREADSGYFSGLRHATGWWIAPSAGDGREVIYLESTGDPRVEAVPAESGFSVRCVR